MILAWYDFWIGLYYDVGHRTLYILPLPMVVFRFQLPGRQDETLHRKDRESHDPTEHAIADGYIPDPWDFDEEADERDEAWHNRETICETCGGVTGPEYSTCACDDEGDSDEDWEERERLAMFEEGDDDDPSEVNPFIGRDSV